MKRKPHVDGKKHCGACGEWKPLGDFYADKCRADGLYPTCRRCAAEAKARSRAIHGNISPEYKRAWRAANPEKIRRHNRRRQLKEYGLTEESYAALLMQQDRRCKICACTAEGRALHVDHDHKTGRIRGLLCTNCNTALGLLKETPELFMRAVVYLEAGV